MRTHVHTHTPFPLGPSLQGWSLGPPPTHHWFGECEISPGSPFGPHPFILPQANTHFIYSTSRHSPGALTHLPQCILPAQLPLHLVLYRNLLLTFSLGHVETTTIHCYYSHFTAEMKWSTQGSVDQVVGLELDLSFLLPSCYTASSSLIALSPTPSAPGAAVAFRPRGGAAGEFHCTRRIPVCPARDRAPVPGFQC